MWITEYRKPVTRMVSGLVAGLIVSLPVQAVEFSKLPEVDAFIEELVKEEGFDRPALKKLFQQAEHKARIIELMDRPAERRLTWGEYCNLFISDQRVSQGVAFWKNNREILEKAQQQYGVPPFVVLGILGVETGYGRQSGGYRVVDSLSTLGFNYPRRATFFRGQLKELLILAREQGFDPLELTGSYAGAMGIPQFMPSSFREYAIDFDNNGKADIWGSTADAIGSIASYLSRHGWVPGKPVAARANVKGTGFAKALDDNPRPSLSMNQVQKMGWNPNQVLPDSARVRGLELEGNKGTEYWLTLTNFYVITRYNRSNLYAMAVYQLGRQVEAEYQAELKRSGEKLQARTDAG